ncbi:MAG: DNA polymerase III subunit gamma/tau [Alphaproteobacteria bacterium]|nr:DNA polymerase III subunit gamma/tau [Alphaproteobacteria bacterium]
MTDKQEQNTSKKYTVLARKYRPKDFSDLIGQEALVRTLSNAIETGRIAQAYILTGVRGIGKTSTARIIARGLNCIGKDGNGGATVNPCGECENCKAIAEDRHVDVLEMDAASRTGVDDMRELLDGVRYRPSSARYKIYIIDEVHMLSKHAFNAVLKTLEEPPEHVKFIFATTEIRKVPVTVLSRCQRFDLRRVDMDVLSEHFAGIANKEKAKVEDEALKIISRSADGSVRDGLSLLDQAIAHGNGKVTAEQIRDMIGLADRAVVFDLFESLMKGEVKGALEAIEEQYAHGADPLVVLQDLLELTYWMTRVKIVPEMAEDPAVPENERVRGKEMSDGLSMPVLTRTWQIILKGMQEVQTAPSPLQAAEMVLVRLAYASSLPTPEETLKQLAEKKTSDLSGNPSFARKSGGAGGTTGVFGGRAPMSVGGQAVAQQPLVNAVPFHNAPNPQSFDEVAELFKQKKEMPLYVSLLNDVSLVKFENTAKMGRIDINVSARAPRDCAQKVSQMLTEWTAKRWMVTIVTNKGQETLKQQNDKKDEAKKLSVSKHPVVAEILKLFPDAEIKTIKQVIKEELPDDMGDADEAYNNFSEFSDDLF